MTPKYKIGQKVKIEGVITIVDEDDDVKTYKVDIADKDESYNLWFSESNLSPAEEPKEEIVDGTKFCQPNRNISCVICTKCKQCVNYCRCKQPPQKKIEKLEFTKEQYEWLADSVNVSLKNKINEIIDLLLDNNKKK